MQNPGPAPVGEFIRKNVIPAGMSVKEAASRLGVGRPALSNLLNGNAALSPDMAGRLEKSFGADRHTLLDMQAAALTAKRGDADKSIAVRRYVPNFLSIKAHQIEEWADHLDARQLLPVLLRRLVHSTTLDLRDADFPGYDNSQRKGPDGIVEADSATAWVPAGKSYWELGVSGDPQAKANKDYRARVKSVPADERKKSTFVFVTPRNWPNKDSWRKERSERSEWANIRVFDANSLEQWLEESIPAQIWLAEKLGMPTTGFETLDRCWERWAAGSEPRMTPDIFAPSIATHSEAFTTWLGKDSDRTFGVAADSRDEALAFIACMLEQADAGSRSKHLAAVFESPEALRTLASSSSLFIPIATTEAAERELVTVYRNHHSIVVRPRNAVDSEPDVALDLLRHDAFEKALAAMGITGDAVDRLARESGMSPTILRRRLSRIDAIRSPAWATDSGTARTLIPLMLIGAWNAKVKADIEILSVLTNRPYDSIEEDIRRLLQLDDPPVWSAGNYRGVASKIDLVFAVAKAVAQKDLDEFFVLAEYVLSEADPALELPEDDRWAAGIYGKVRDHSAALRKGMCETLVILSVHGNSLFKGRLGIDVTARVNKLIASLLTPLTLDRLMSTESHLPRFAEAAPETFLRIVEADLSTTEPVVLGLLKPASTGVFGRCHRVGLLWALECLAWKPQNLARVAAVLARLSRTTIDDNWTNKPIKSLAAIFRSWMPQTAASLEERTKALGLLVNRYPDIAWQICIEQFSPGSRTGDYNYRPHWRSDASGAGQPASTRKEVYEFARKSLDLALAWPSHDEDSLGDLVERLDGMAEEDSTSVWRLIEEWAVYPRTTDRARAALRERVRRFALTRVGRLRVKDMATRNRARDIHTLLEPSDPAIKHGWLFAKHWVEESVDEHEDYELDYTARERRVHALRLKALAEIWSQRGFDGIAALLNESEAATTVGHYAAHCVTDPEARVGFVLRCLAVQGDMESKADACIFGFLGTIDEGPRDVLIRAVANPLDTDQRVRLFKSSPFEKSTWLIVDEYSEDFRTRYWKVALPQWSHRHSDSDLNELVDRLLSVQRPRAAFYAAHMDWTRLETARIKRLLTDVSSVGAEPQGTYQLSSHDVSEALMALDGRAGVTVNDMAQMEFRFASALEHSEHGIPNLERQIADSPLLYMQMMALLWKRSDEGQDPPEWRIEDPEQHSAIASAMHGVLEQMRRIPGTSADGEIATADLADWIEQVRRLAAQHSRAEITDQCIGQLLAKAPPKNKDIWPCAPVCQAMERIASSAIAKGFVTGVYNSRGAHFRGEGGTQERELAARYRDWSQKLAFEYPYVARILEDIAVAYDLEAEWQDTEANVSKRLRH